MDPKTRPVMAFHVEDRRRKSAKQWVKPHKGIKTATEFAKM
jgi:hypothetical protein